jgi:hypothetical protein
MSYTTQQHQDAALFGDSLTTRSAVPAKAHKAASLPNIENNPLLGEAAWVELRDSGIAPYQATEMVTTEESRREFLIGAALLGLADKLKPQMLQVCDVLAAGRLLNGVIEPRRSSKTTTLICVLLGRCALREDHMAGFTLATTQKKTAERYRLDIYKPLTKLYPEEDDRPFVVYKGNGTERVEFPATGSVLAVLSPDGEAIRSGAYDTLLVDEGGEASPEMGEDIQSAVLPTLDTRPDAQFIVAGTAANYREGNLLYDMLNDPTAGVLRFTVPDTVTDEQLADWEPTEDNPEACVRALIESMHPGIGTLTTLERIEVNFRKLTREQFSREYLGLFGTIGATSGLLDIVKWAACGTGADLPTPPERFGLAIAPHPDQLTASVMAVWRDEDKRAVLLLLEHKTGVNWLAREALRLSRKYETAIIYDSGAQVALLAVEALQRARPRPRLHPLGFMDIKKAAALLVDEVERGTLVHYRQPELDGAAIVAVKRKAGVNGWALGRHPKSPGDDITPLEAASLALLVYDTTKPAAARRKPRVQT